MRKAFTLLELLVAVAIVAILAALLFPVFAKARRRAQGTQCIGNLKQLSAAIDIYTQDWEGRYPNAWGNGVAITPEENGLPFIMRSYVKDKRLWQCPSDTGETWPHGSFSYGKPTAPFYSFLISSYGWMGLYSSPPARDLSSKGITYVKIPSLAPMLAEMRPWHGSYKPDDGFEYCPGLCNVLYCDGHVQGRTGRQWNDDQADAFGYPHFWK